MRQVQSPQLDALLVGIETRDDAGVYQLNDTTALVFTADFFTPIVDDPTLFGRIAAANALSDVYAMGARPLMALNLLGFPTSKLPMSALEDILKGGQLAIGEASAALVGGHSIEAEEPLYGLAVVGVVDPTAVFRNVGARPGDALILTKPLGTGIITTGLKRGLARPVEVQTAIDAMVTINRSASEVFVAHREDVHALTDVTGYGLLGHLMEMLEGSDVSATLHPTCVPMLSGARRMAEEGIVPGGSRANLDDLGVRLERGAVEDGLVHVLADAQTSGGLLAAVAPEAASTLIAALKKCGVSAASVIGCVTVGPPIIRLDEALA